MTTEVDVDIHLDVSLSSLQRFDCSGSVLRPPCRALGDPGDPGAAVSCLL